jgi:hypothetical protein
VGQRARAVRDLGRDVAEGGRVDALDVAEAGVDPLRVEEDLTDGGEGIRDLGVGELHVTGYPLVVHLGTGLTQDEVLDPVGAGPAGSVT